MNPKVSVITSVYNGERFLLESITSILRQSFRDYEIVLINDGSTDKTQDILNSVFPLNFNVLLLKNDSNIGAPASLNRAIRHSSGRYIARLDADDISRKHRLQHEVEVLESRPDIGLVGTDGFEIDEAGNVIGEIIMPKNSSNIKANLFRRNPFIHSSVMVRRRVLEQCGGYNTDFPYAHDYELWFRLLQHEEAINLPEKDVGRRYHRQSITLSRKKRQLFYHIKAWIAGCRYHRPGAGDYLFLLTKIFLLLAPSIFNPLQHRRRKSSSS